MRIVIDMQGAQTESRFRGIGRYSMAFAQAVVRNRGKHEIFLALSGLLSDTIEPIRATFDGLLPQENIRVWHAPGPVRACQSGNECRREVAELIREGFLASFKPDVIHINSLFEGYFDDAVTSIGQFDRCTQVSVSLHDMIPELIPCQHFNPHPGYAQYYQRKLDYLKKASTIFTIFGFSHQGSMPHLGVPEDRLINVSCATEAHFHHLSIDKKTEDQLRKKFGLGRLSVLYTGGSNECNNLPRLIEAYTALEPALRQHHQFVCAGKMAKGDIERIRHVAEVAGLSAEELVFTSYSSNKELAQLYNLCDLAVFPCWQEGEGLSALEAMACGAPVIGANASSLAEIISLEDAMFDPLSVKAISKKMRRALADEVFRDQLRTHGLRRLQRFSRGESGKREIVAWEALLATRSQSRIGVLTGNPKPKLALVSPLPPERSGIADYSAELLPALAEYYDIEAVVSQERVNNPRIAQYAKIRDAAWLKEKANEVDRVLYHIGNSPFHAYMLALLQDVPGVVVLHDFFLGHLYAHMDRFVQQGVWAKELYGSHGYAATVQRFNNPEIAVFDFPCSFHVIKNAQGVIVHSEHSRKVARQWYGAELSNDWQVIPLLRLPAASFNKTLAKRQLGLSPDDFLICSFGFLGEIKLNHRLLECWLNSSLSKDASCHLVFVGENHGGKYGATLLQNIRARGPDKRISITGFVSPDLFRQYLMAADLAVQLRTQSRGETSAAVLDCMNYSLPVIVNAAGAMAEISPSAVYMLPEEFNDKDLIRMLETMKQDPNQRLKFGQSARTVILEKHSPANSASLYAEAIEKFHNYGNASMESLLYSIAANGVETIETADILNLSASLAASLPLARPAKRLFLDVTVTSKNDLKTGIERVARALMVNMIEASPPAYRIEPVYLEQIGHDWFYRHARRYTLGLLECPMDGLRDEIVEPESGDILVGLDLSGDMLIQACKAGLLDAYRNKGVAVYSIVFDLLPVQMPEVFPIGMDAIHRQWLETISRFDGALCISNAVAEDLNAWYGESRLNVKNRRPYSIDWFHLGADVANSCPSQGLPGNASELLAQLKARPSFLMVGTIEPRKGYLQAINTFTLLWEDNVDINLVVVGKEGWQALPNNMRRDIPQTVQQLRSHSEINKRLYWLEGISDTYLEKLYVASTCLIAPSYGEGFGLPLIEASQKMLPIIARDIPVFREVAGEHAYYFDAQTPEALALAIKTWLAMYKLDQHPKSDKLPWLTWKESTKQLLKVVLSKVHPANEYPVL